MSTVRGVRGRRATTALVLAGVLSLGLAAAPVVFQMFSRAPAGGRMLDDFRPYMDRETITSFRGHLSTIDAAAAESAELTSAGERPPGLATFLEQWPAAERDLTSMLDTIEANLDNFAAVDALPPFALFPWFFVLPGLIGAGLAGWGLARTRGGRSAGPALAALAALGVGLLAAPALFQMFTRAPLGEEMIDDFGPVMTAERVHGVQRSFLVIGGAEGALRRQVLPALDDPASEAPAVTAFVERWQPMAAEMAPMIGAMADNLDSFAGVAALPPFGLFPWFFVAPGLLLLALAVLGRRDRSPDAAAEPADAPVAATPAGRTP